MIGKPRISAGVAWCCFGLAWFLLAAFDGHTVMQFLLGTAWLALGVFHGVVALHDRKHGRGFYQTANPAGAPDEGSERD
jgi:uncharacterized membrane protein HdeD (DUF308 family)